eukprot:PhF_6_TR20003/c0_g1_i1/m.29197
MRVGTFAHCVHQDPTEWHSWNSSTVLRLPSRILLCSCSLGYSPCAGNTRNGIKPLSVSCWLLPLGILALLRSKVLSTRKEHTTRYWCCIHRKVSAKFNDSKCSKQMMARRLGCWLLILTLIFANQLSKRCSTPKPLNAS